MESGSKVLRALFGALLLLGVFWFFLAGIHQLGSISIVEYNVLYIYHAMYAYFDRDNVALRGLAKFFKESSEEERGHAEKFMEYQNIRGGRVKLQSILMPLSEFDHAQKGDALYAMELALSLEKLTNEKLLNLHHVVDRNKDVQLSDFIETKFLTILASSHSNLLCRQNLGLAELHCHDFIIFVHVGICLIRI